MTTVIVAFGDNENDQLDWWENEYLPAVKRARRGLATAEDYRILAGETRKLNEDETWDARHGDNNA